MNLCFRRSIVTGHSAAGIFRFRQETESEREVEQAVRAAWSTDDVAKVTIGIQRPDPVEVNADPRMDRAISPDPATQAQATLVILLDIIQRLKAGQITVEQAVDETTERLGPDLAKKVLRT